MFEAKTQPEFTRTSLFDGFVRQIWHLIDHLVANGHNVEAENIRDQSLAVLDDARLKSAAVDPRHKVAK